MPIAPNGPEQPAASSPVLANPAAVGPDSANLVSASPTAVGLDADGDEPYVRIIPAGSKTEHRAD